MILFGPMVLCFDGEVARSSLDHYTLIIVEHHHTPIRRAGEAFGSVASDPALRNPPAILDKKGQARGPALMVRGGKGKLFGLAGGRRAHGLDTRPGVMSFSGLPSAGRFRRKAPEDLSNWATARL